MDDSSTHRSSSVHRRPSSFLCHIRLLEFILRIENRQKLYKKLISFNAFIIVFDIQKTFPQKKCSGLSEFLWSIEIKSFQNTFSEAFPSLKIPKSFSLCRQSANAVQNI